MSEFEQDKRLDKYAKQCRKIQYSTKVFEKNKERPKIILRELTKGEEDKRIWTIILKYEISDGIPQEVIIGTLGDTVDRKIKAIEIINIINGQLEENLISEEGYKNYEKIFEYVQSENIPFKLTIEGTDILTNKRKENIQITRTCFENEQGKIENLFTQKDLEKMEQEKNLELSRYIKNKKIVQKWRERREKILESFKTKEKKQDFLKGEKITQFIQKTDEEMDVKQDIVAEYLLEAFEEERGNDNPKLSLAKGYLMIKEKGIAIDIKRTLEDIENRYYKEIKEKEGEISIEEYKKIELIDDYKNFFDLVKTGKNWNARLLALKLKNINFDILRKIFKNFKGDDKELLQYIELKEKMINEVQTTTIEVEYNKYNSVKDLYQFLLNSSIREKTREDDEHVIHGVYQHVKREILESNFDAVELYNNYAEKSNIPVCPLPQTKKISEERPISKVVEKICRSIDSKEIDSPENNDEQR